MNIIITGASRGIGKAIAARFIREGWHAALCSKQEFAMQDAAQELRQLNAESRVCALAADLGVRESVEIFARKAMEFLGSVDVLVNNAGIFLPGSIQDEAEGVLENTLAVNLLSAYHLSRALIPAMKDQGHGYIFNMCSTASLRAYPNGGSYSISKFALLGFSKNLREELAPAGIRVSSICPGPTLTDSWKGFEAPPDRMMQPQDVAEVVWSACALSPQTVLEDIVMRPQLGDIS